MQYFEKKRKANKQPGKGIAGEKKESIIFDNSVAATFPPNHDQSSCRYYLVFPSFRVTQPHCLLYTRSTTHAMILLHRCSIGYAVSILALSCRKAVLLFRLPCIPLPGPGVVLADKRYAPNSGRYSRCAVFVEPQKNHKKKSRKREVQSIAIYSNYINELCFIRILINLWIRK